MWGCVFLAAVLNASVRGAESKSDASDPISRVSRPRRPRSFVIVWNDMWRKCSHHVPQAREGYRFLTEKVYLPADFNEQSCLAGRASTRYSPDDARPVSSRHATWRAFGISPRHDDPTKPLQYVATEDGQFCHELLRLSWRKHLWRHLSRGSKYHLRSRIAHEQVRRAKLRTRYR